MSSRFSGRESDGRLRDVAEHARDAQALALAGAFYSSGE